ncbi:hypothetical protein [Aquitalea aquatica]|uniref:Phage protein n=1 Tax=Aquitalea aquatica TaxID=3044273 RepID=A0A838XWM7_9NEIS|nr:hypothetical protein [Aquitalea magnusonii]MBA4707550.1 hypothetical protein [Aquitalea magnusonii]
MSKQSDVQLAWSENGEDFTSESLCELIENGELQPGQTIYVGEVKYHSTDWIGADDVIDMIADRGYDEGGEYAECFPDVSEEAQAELEAFLAAWQAKHCAPSFFQVINVKEHVITEEEYAEAKK